MNQTNAKLVKRFINETEVKDSNNQYLFTRGVSIETPDFIEISSMLNEYEVTKALKNIYITDIHVKESLKQKQPTYIVMGDLQFLILPSDIKKTRDGDILFKTLPESFKNIVASMKNMKYSNDQYVAVAPFLTNDAKLRLSVNNSAYIQGIVNLRNFVTSTQDYSIFASSKPLYNFTGKMLDLNNLYKRDVADLQREKDVRLVIQPTNVKWFLDNFSNGYFEYTNEHGTVLFHDEDVDFSKIENSLYSYIMNRTEYYRQNLVSSLNDINKIKSRLSDAYDEFLTTKEQMYDDFSINNWGGILNVNSRYYEMKKKF